MLFDRLDCAPDPEELLMARNLADAAVEHGEPADEVKKPLGAAQRVHCSVLSRNRAIAFGAGFLRVGSGRVALTKDGAWLDLPLEPVATLEGRRGVSEHLLRQRLAADAPVLLRIQAAP